MLSSAPQSIPCIKYCFQLLFSSTLSSKKRWQTVFPSTAITISLRLTSTLSSFLALTHAYYLVNNSFLRCSRNFVCCLSKEWLAGFDMCMSLVQISRLTVVSREAKKKQHTCASSGPRDHYSEYLHGWQL